MANLEKYKDAARKHELKENWPKAIEVLVRAIEEFEKSPDNEADLVLFNKVGDLYVKVNDSANAIQYYERAVDLYSEASLVNPAIALCNKVLRLSPGRAGTYLKLGMLFAKKGFAAEAKQNLLEYADRMQKAGQIEEAFKALKKFAEMTPGQEEIWSVLSQQAKAQAKTPEAKEQIDKLLAEFDAKDKATAQRKSRSSRHMVTGEEIKEDPKPKKGELIFLDVDDVPSRRSGAMRTGSMKPVAPPAPPAPPPEPPAPPAAEPRVSAPGAAPPPPEPRVSTPKAAPPPPPRRATPPPEPEPLQIETTSLADDVPASPPADLPLIDIEPTAPPRGATPMLEGLEQTGFEPPPKVDALDLEHTSLEIEPPAPPKRASTRPPAPEAPALDVEPADLDLPAAAHLAEAGAQESPEPADGLDLGEVEIRPEDLAAARASSAREDLPFIDLGEPTPAATDEPEVPSTPAANPIAAPVSEMQIVFEPPPQEAPEPPPEEPTEAEVAQSIEFQDLGAVEEPTGPTLDDLIARVADNPDDWEAHRQYGEALIEAGDREQGIAELDASLNGFDAADDLATAQSLVEEILRIEPNSVRHQQKRVELAYRSGDRARLVDAYVELADALLRSNEPDKSIAVYQRVLEHDPGNVRARSAIETLAPPEPPQAEPARPAKPAAKAPAAQAPAAPAPAAAAPESGGDYVDLGAMLLDEEAPKDTRMRIEDEEPTGDEQKDFQNMLAAFKKGIDANVGEEDFQSHFDLGIAYKEMGLLDEAIAEFQKALRAPDGKLKASEALGLCFYEKQQFAVAETILKRGLDNPANGDAERVGLLYWLGRTQEEQGKEKDALESYNRVFAVDINFQDVNQRVAALGQADTGAKW